MKKNRTSKTIINPEDTCDTRQRYKKPTSNQRSQTGQAHNRFHYKCCDMSKKSAGTNKEKLRSKLSRQLSLEFKEARMVNGPNAYHDLCRLLTVQPSLLDQYVHENVKEKQLQTWLSNKEKKNNITTPKVKIPQKFKLCRLYI